MTEQYGSPIPVNGRPDWLRDDDLCVVTYNPHYHDTDNYLGVQPREARQRSWPQVLSVRLPITHPASICQQRALDHPDERPWTPIHADGTVPVDYDGGRALLRIGWLGAGINWKENGNGTIVGYRRKATTDAEFAAFKADIVAALVGTPQATTAGPIPTCAPELPTYDPATHVLVERMTRDQFAKLYMGWKTTAIFDALGAIKPDPDPIAEYAAKHGLDVDELRALVKGVAA